MKRFKLRVSMALWGIAGIALSIYSFIDGDTIFEFVVLFGVSIFMVVLAILDPKKPKPKPN